MSIIETMRGRNGKRAEPMLEPLPSHDGDDDPAEVKAWLASARTVREERAFYRDQCAHLSNELRLQQESNRRLTAELTDVRKQRDVYQAYALGIRKGLKTIRLLIDAEDAAAEQHPIPEPTQPQTEEPSAELVRAVETAIIESEKT